MQNLQPGTNGQGEQTLLHRPFKELAEHLELPRHEVREIEARAMAKLRHPCMGYQLHELLAAS